MISTRRTAGRYPAIDRSLDPELIRAFCDRLSAAGLADDRLGLAVSGGPDSVALLLLAHAASHGRIEAATVDHGLREGSAAEADMVAALCSDLDVPHQILSVTVASGNMQSNARGARYAALAGWMQDRSLDTLLTAHHADDQAETFLMRLNRGSGLSGLAGIRRDGNVPGTALRLHRPLLGWRKADLQRAVDAAGISAAQDPSNTDERFDRAKVRKALSDMDWLDVDAITRSANHLADAEEAIQSMTEDEWSARVRRTGAKYVYRPSAPKIVRLRIIERIVSQFSEQVPRGGDVATMLERLERGDNASLARVLARAVGDAWKFEREPPRMVG